ncbi:osmoprotectant NAGGN system M42 family peptidase [Billgrantia diversa]|uniref:osmoprotectant NAGGN system M42 family peptidase n=1 Tax=Halomonas sp. MCCC 1A13316 TaxID=2733487 RepID=UPI0018A56C13|nr:osmoprotectant NAGGN system M42 family peptidase [Halomonas sp. MCCC 1A13316]QOR38008.1 osmoprotectant NAGGN system M42 family peptidase [Halomonas sp. MCCC 1A13316]
MSPIDTDALVADLLAMLAIPSPSLHAQQMVVWLAPRLEAAGLEVATTARGDLYAQRQGDSPLRAITAHLDTLGAMVVRQRNDGRLAIRPIGTWNARFASGARVRVHDYDGNFAASGTLLPEKASGHVFNEAVDAQTSSWEHTALRLDLLNVSSQALEALGIGVGSLVSIDSQPVVTETGFINARHLDNKAAIACVLAALRAGADLTGTRLVFSCAEELGVGMNEPLLAGVEEVLNLDIAAQGEGQQVCSDGVTIAFMNSQGPLHPVASRRLVALCQQHAIPFTRDCFPFYYCDGDSASQAGMDLRNALACFGADASHGWERVHCDSLVALTQLVVAWLDDQE